MRKTPYIPGAEQAEEPPERPSKSQKKRDMHALQDLGEELVALSPERLSKVPLPDNLRAAIEEAQRIKSHEGRRRQLQLVGKLMRSAEPEPIRALLDAFNGASKEETARLHRLERLREAFLADEAVLTEIMNTWPGADSQHLRTLRRNALREREKMKPPRSYREIFRLLRDLEEASRAG
ncbi:MAG: hypothetical protein RIR70_331 [Pseudomonadota bacterium]|jgi:ribosome-associated protein